ncbi:MAG TPA: chemotaxis protein CheX [Acetobacteraceae bacterium]|nr:chemotaxis protein CheX [Acetobacteraceae bacterium]
MTEPASEPGFTLSELELDALGELVNIGVSRAAASLGTMVGEQVLLSVPSVMLVSRSRAAELISASRLDLLVAVRQAFHGDVSGRALLIFPEKNSLELVRAVAGEELSLEDILELEHEALAEIGNIILNACIATVANLLQRSLTMSLPEIVRGTSDGLFDLSVSLAEDVVLFVHINFSFKGRQVVGYVAMVMDFASLASLKQLVADVIRRMAG